ncbi:hypothetical protein [Streptomyces massasporeus]|uniref:hypothetical protein n=1 Tax=Streptomyces massasporeus TaxID=67324 RepID=UPI0038206D30
MTTETTEATTKHTPASTSITVFLARSAEVRSSAPPSSSLYIDAAGMSGAHHLSLLFTSTTPVAEQVQVAERVLAGVQRWRDGIVGYADQQRSAEEELAAAREEIARLKAERDGGDDA